MSLVKNIPLLQKALDHIEAHPEEWHQGYWGLETSCGTVACLAGHVTLADGWAPVLDHESALDPERRTWAGVFKEGVKHSWVEPVTKEPYEVVEQAALDALGIDYDEWESWTMAGGRYLFSAGNDREDIWEIANAMTDNQLTLPPDLQEKSAAKR